MKKQKTIIVYKGDEFITCGTAQEIADFFGKTKNNIQSKVAHFRLNRKRGMKISKNSYQWYEEEYEEIED